MRTPGDFPAHLRDAPFTRAAALAAGLSGSRLRSRDVTRVGHGVYRWTGTPGPTTTPPTPTAPPAEAASATPPDEERRAREARKESARRREVDRLQELLARHPDLVVTGASACVKSRVTPPSVPGASLLRRRMFANVPRIITSWLPRRDPYELKSRRSTPCSVR